MAIEVVNNIADPNNLIFSLLILGAYLHILNIDLLIPNIIQKTINMKKAINKVQKI